MKGYQFQIDGRGFGAPFRREWHEAAQDAVNAGYGVWSVIGQEIKLDDQAEIARVEI